MNLKQWEIYRYGSSICDMNGETVCTTKTISDYDGLNIYVGRTRYIIDKDIPRANIINALREYEDVLKAFADDIENR